MRLRTKLWLIVIVSIVLSLTLFITLSLWMGQKFNNGYDLKSLDKVIETTLEQIQAEQAFTKEQAQLTLDNIHKQHPQLRFEWLASDGIPIYDTSGQSTPYSFKELTERFISMPTRQWADGQPITFAASADKDGQSYYLLVSLPGEAMNPGQLYIFIRNYEALFRLALPLLLAFITPYLLSLWFFSKINRRLRKLDHALSQVNLRGKDIILQDNAKDEISRLNMHYNEMTRRIRSQINQIEQFEIRRKVLLSNLSHDLRTPLTMILGYAETIRLGHYDTAEQLKSSAKTILKHSRYMESLLKQILEVSRLDTDGIHIRYAHEDLSELVRILLADYFLMIDEKTVTLDFHIPSTELIIEMDATLIERAIRNLLDNAIRYGNEGHYLGVRLNEEGENVLITITDKGKGVAPENRDLIFERFYRSDGRSGQGLGIGLSIVKEIAEAHQGSVEMSSLPFVETVFQLRLPKNRAN
ncbi:cell wall metabolism sensor histidine kinase WalK [Cohnella sp. WQ 127256]|uniref:sensor histidine kinase n=1 Tax=Cohnella sp. WQ 127256 TaxID=2938790 RepID=UPI0021187392|nr:HAMP domain-containing sensor histidine kinase [Cohnella sp. WQ 127256]